MGTLTGKAELALRESIESWEATAAQTVPEMRGADACALCRAYPTNECRVGDGDDEVCPIQALDYHHCNGTPCSKFAITGTQAAAEAEVAFLRAVLDGTMKRRWADDDDE